MQVLQDNCTFASLKLRKCANRLGVMSKRDAIYFGMRLRQAMALKGLKPKHLADRLHVDESVVSRWVNGRTNPRDARKEKIAKAIGMTLDEIYDLKPFSHGEHAKGPSPAPGTGRRIMQHGSPGNSNEAIIRIDDGLEIEITDEGILNFEVGARIVSFFGRADRDRKLIVLAVLRGRPEYMGEVSAQGRELLRQLASFQKPGQKRQRGP